MIHFFTGKPGGGKSLAGTSELIKELVHSDRDVVTNIPLNMERLNEYLQQRYPHRSIPLVGPDARLRLLDDQPEVRKLYWEYRNAWKRAPNAEHKEAVYQEFEGKIRALGLPEETRNFWKYRNPRKLRFDDARGTLFVLDECHLHFNARKWMQTGAEALEYLSQHRHFGDDVILITQHADNVDAQFRRLVEDWAVIKNGYTQKIGFFRAMPMFVRKMYTNQPTGGVKQTPFETVRFRLDVKGIASCYNTAGGAGIFGKDADKNKPKKGLHPAWFPVAVVAAAILSSVILKAGLSVLRHKGEKTFLQIDRDEKPQMKSLTPSASSPAPLPAIVQPQSVAAPIVVTEKQVTVRGYVARNGRVNVILSDGRTLTEQDKSLERIQRNGAMVDGKKLYMMTPPPPLKPRDLSPQKLIDGSEPEAKTSSIDQLEVVNQRSRDRINNDVPIANPSSEKSAIAKLPKSSMSEFDSRKIGVRRLVR